MIAAIYRRYGPADVVELQTIPLPLVKPDEVLVQVHYGTVNRTDCAFRSAQHVINRLVSGLIRPRHPVLGCEFSGVVAAVGHRVHQFRVGEEVFGYDDGKFGAHAEYKTIRATGTIAQIPRGFTLREAAALTEGSHYALSHIRAASLQRTARVLVNGATGAIGSAAVQLLRDRQAYIVAVAPKAHQHVVKQLGADQIIDYESQDFTRLNEQFDLVIDAVGKSSFRACKPLLKKHGIYISSELGKHAENLIFSIKTWKSNRQRVLFPIPRLSQEDLLYLKTLAETRQFSPLIDHEFPLNDIVSAYRYVESGQKIGNVLLKIPHS